MAIDQDAPPAGSAKDILRPNSSREGSSKSTEYSGAANSPLTRATIFLFAVASGLAVANAYFAHPLLDVMADDLKLSRTVAGLIVGATQLGYGFGLILLVPLGDLVDRRKLIIVQSLLSVAALISVGSSSSAAMLLASMTAVGFLAVVTQALVAYAASLAHPAERGHIVGVVTSGIVLGILLARSVAGTLTDLSGWRTVYIVSAVLTLVIALLLWRALPRQEKPRSGLSYFGLIRSLGTLLVEEPVLRIRGIIAMLIFANITTLLAPLVMPLTAPPYSLSHTEVGLFGLAGAAGALGAIRAGRWADRGHGQRTTGIALALMLLAWLPISMLDHSILWLILGVLVIDFGLQAVHVTNQGMIYRVRPDAQNRLTAAYMVFYSIGSAVGSSTSTIIYAHAGWSGVCISGTAISLVTLLFWALTLRATPEVATQSVGRGKI
ncbi:MULTISPECIES: MFS transporter [Rhizobium]|uniref:MFS family arabinose efflux permease n=1 Tax=Rhizobium tropici TaxID=398 RepID=A0A6P1CAN7_RHITR|nr:MULTISPECIES: MFS transporter [Rhizobium]AGB69660.1 major facilitator superfamily (MFS) transporter [Rhizobium tropici CIAT 899]MBB4244042.1 putative MFS family arabinose efflux permease [Rhizobium tropici]MBB5595121.1 putative MFS family arabinose efflux permease [Rhizobium tropici]MBB6494381.1 putative MFS family arabinose efflux permease [Rhizobium tropici]NEV12525.1 MFS transporter [Rhizobium tropici]